jgi:hypothetical protein
MMSALIIPLRESQNIERLEQGDFDNEDGINAYNNENK